MKKPIIKNWIKYWTTTVAITGMLAMGACDNNNNNTTDDAVDATEETVITAREDVNQNLEEAEAETEQATNMEENEPQPQYERNTNAGAASGRSANTIRDMDSHIDEHQNENEAIREELTEAELKNQNRSNAQPANSQGTQSSVQQGQNQSQESQQQGQTEGYNTENQPLTEPTQQKNSLNNQQQDSLNIPQGDTDAQQRTFDQQGENGAKQEIPTNQEGASEMNQQENTSGMDQQDTSLGQQDQQQATNRNDQNTNGLENVDDPNTPAAIYERHIAVYSEGLSEYAQQRFNDIMSDYRERRESMRGEINEESGAYIAAEVDPQPTIGFDELKNQIQREVDYPRTAAAARVEGVVLVNLVVDENGKIEEAKASDEFIEASSDYPKSFTEEDIEEAKKDMKEEAERAVKETSGLWEAAEQNGQKVRSEIQIPVQFIMEDTGIGEHEDLGKGVGNPSNVQDINE